MPPPSVALVLFRSGAQALVWTLARHSGKKRVSGPEVAHAFIRRWLHVLAREEAIIPLRKPSEVGEVVALRRQAFVWLSSIQSALLEAADGE